MILRIALVALLVALASPAFAEIESPKKQTDGGTAPRDVICKEGMELVIMTRGSAACIRPETVPRFQEAGLILEYIGPTEAPEIKAPEEDHKAPEDLKMPEVRDAQVPEPPRAQSAVSGVPATGLVHFYITDHDLNLAHGGIEVVSTEGLVEFLVRGIAIDGPDTMIETGPDTGIFHIKLQIPDAVNGVPLEDGDVVTLRYLDQADYSGNSRVLTESVSLASTFAKVETAGGGTRIGHEFTVRVYEPDANLDSKDEDKIPLDRLEFRTEGRIKTTLANPVFDANSAYLVETGRNTDTFEVRIEIPRTIDGKTVHIGHWYEIRYIDTTNPAGTPEKIVYRGVIGTAR